MHSYWSISKQTTTSLNLVEQILEHCQINWRMRRFYTYLNRAHLGADCSALASHRWGAKPRFWGRYLNASHVLSIIRSSFIEKGKKVTVNQQKMFEIIPRIFKNQYNCRFGQSFHAIQLFIYYGSDVLSQNYPAIESIVDMSLISISTL